MTKPRKWHVRVFAGRTLILLVLSWRGSFPIFPIIFGYSLSSPWSLRRLYFFQTRVKMFRVQTKTRWLGSLKQQANNFSPTIMVWFPWKLSLCSSVRLIAGGSFWLNYLSSHSSKSKNYLQCISILFTFPMTCYSISLAFLVVSLRGPQFYSGHFQVFNRFLLNSRHFHSLDKIYVKFQDI